ncbi:MAG TPA: hypothetical protein VHL78_12630 [Actinomycetota bacterium]|nr:hypothetical protein [Actinomycetota bacterium]
MRKSLLFLTVAVATVVGAAAGPAAGQLVSVVPLEQENVEHVTNRSGMTGGHIDLQPTRPRAEDRLGPDRLYVGAYGLGFRIFDVSTPDDPVLMGQYTPGLRADAVPQGTIMGERHIAVLQGTRRVTNPAAIRTDRTEFIDVTNPQQPRVLWTFIGQDDGEAHMGKVFDQRSWWIPTGGTGDNGLRIYDMRPILKEPPQAPERLFPPDECRASADVRCDPVALWESSPYRDDDEPVGHGFTHSHEVTVYPNYPVRQPDGSYARRTILLMAEGGNYLNDAGETGSLFIIDITDPRNPVVLERWIHEGGEGHHPIRYYHEAQFLDSDRRTMLLTDEDLHSGCGEGGSGVYALRVSEDLTELQELSEWFIPPGTPAPVCAPHVFDSERNLVFFGSYTAGLQVVDYADPSNPERVGSYIPEGSNAWGAIFWKDVIYVGEMGPRGLDVYEYTGPTNTRLSRR